MRYYLNLLLIELESSEKSMFSRMIIIEMTPERD